MEGKGAMVWKADLSMAYRQLQIDPLDAPLMGFRFDGQIYIDLCPAFGCRSSSAACQRIANAMVYIMAQAGFHTIAYLDDYAGCVADSNTAHEAYDHFKQVARSLGLQLADKKCVPPTTKLQWLGYDIDTENMVLAIPKDKLNEVLKECRKWADRSKANKNAIQSLIGKLVYVSNCIPYARKFLSRILATLRNMQDREWTTIDQDFKKDVQNMVCRICYIG